MTMMFFLMSISSTLMFLIFSTPLAMAATLIFQTFIMSMLIGSMMNHFWFMYILILVFVGGVLILFIYATSIFPNEKFSFNQINLSTFLGIILLTSIILFSMKYFFNFNPNMNTLENSMNLISNYKTIYSTKIFSSQTSVMLIFLVNYLFYCMIIVIKMTNFFFGPLRKMY